MKNPGLRPLALFDFDGTMTTEDSSKRFFRKSCQSNLAFLAKYYLGCAWSLLGFWTGKISIRKLKERRAQVFLGRFSTDEIEALSSAFAKEDIPQILRPAALERFKQHLKSGDEVYIVSASFDFCLKAWTQQNGAKLITNRMDWSSGRLTAPDCNGKEKVNRVRKVVNLDEPRDVYAYGDTAGDRPMLAIASHPCYRCFHPVNQK